ncbi:unnamed protein product [Sphagnum troendelagicum]|uniref:RRM domain-containing protein n=1 Tax=Sphagnum troendelagicum TaxID=128251 RepID=A0ABP0TLB5_9BRYO
MASHGEAVAAKSKLAGYDRPFDSGAGYDSENKLFVGNLSWTVDDESLGAKFSNLHGKVLDAKVTFDKESGRSLGFGFVTYSNAEEDFDGRQMRVNLAGDKSPLRTCEF